MIDKIRDCFCWSGGLAIDADGAPRAYHPDNKSGLDALGNAGKPGQWWGLVCTPNGSPIIQGPDDPAPGFYISTTALVDPNRSTKDQRRYVDSSVVPYLVVPRELAGARAVRMGDLAMVSYKGREVGAIVADVGPAGHAGEGSIALADMLGIPSSPRHGGCTSGVSVVIFPQSRTSPAWPRETQEFQAQARLLYEQWGGAAGGWPTAYKS